MITIISKIEDSFILENIFVIFTPILFLLFILISVFKNSIISIKDIEEKITGTNKKYYESEELVGIINDFFRMIVFYITIFLSIAFIEQFKNEKKEIKNTLLEKIENLNTEQRKMIESTMPGFETIKKK
ncbi:MAG: hypothetical protein ACRC0S_03960 [Fusobacteriaceae bacterium]